MNDASERAARIRAARPASRRRLVPVLLFVVAIAVFAADQLVKNWVVSTLPEGQSVPVLGDFLQWHFVRNPGAAFSLASGSTWIFTILATVVVVVILWQIRRLGSLLWAAFFGLLLGGVLGNLTDRLTRDPGFPVGHVIDFISTPWMIPAIYNIADIAICTGMALFVLVTLFGLPLDGSPRRKRGDDEASEDSAAGDAGEASAAGDVRDAGDGGDAGDAEPEVR